MGAVAWARVERDEASAHVHVVAAALAAAEPPHMQTANDHGTVRAARLILDLLPRADREAIGALVMATPDGGPGGAPPMHRLAAALSLRDAVLVPLHGLGRQAVFTALHVGGALLRQAGTRYVLAASQGAHGDGAGVFLLAAAGGAPCLPLPSVSDALGCGAALAAAVERAGLDVRSIRAVAAPGRDPVEAGAAARDAGFICELRDGALQQAPSVEAALVMAATEPPAARTLLWAADPAGRLSACVLEPEAG